VEIKWVYVTFNARIPVKWIDKKCYNNRLCVCRVLVDFKDVGIDFDDSRENVVDVSAEFLIAHLCIS